MAVSPDVMLNAFNPVPFAADPGAEARIGWLATASGNALLVAIAGAPIVVAVNLDLADDEVAIGGPDETGTRRLGLWVHDPTTNLHRLVQAPGSPQVIRSDKDTQFTDALAVNAGENENLTGLNGNQGRIRSITIIATQRLGYEVGFYRTDAFQTADADTDGFIGSVQFAVADGQQIAGVGLFRYDVSGLDFPYVDADGTNELHVTLVTRSGAKNAGAGGALSILVTVEESN